MKVAMWGVGLLGLGILTFFLVSIFGNITVTNQLNYTTMKNTVEAAMYDAIDIAHYRTGFCICTNKTKTTKNGKSQYVFTSSNDYVIKEIENNKCEDINYDNCEMINGEYKIDKKLFAESLVRRFAEMVNNKKDYQIIVQDVIEYPPKVSVRVNSEDGQVFSNDTFTITNQIDAILETNGNLQEQKSVSVPTVDIPDDDPPVIEYYDYYDDYDDEPIPCIDCYNEPQQDDTPIYNNDDTDKKKDDDKSIRNSGGCFLSGTKIVVMNGYKDIDKLNVGDYVLTYNEEKNVNEYKKVKRVFVINNSDEQLYTLKTDDVELTLTSLHRVYTIRNEKPMYISAKYLQIGDVVRYSNGQLHKITGISYKPLEETVYNIETEDNHNFYVGAKEILVHNDSVVNCVDGIGSGCQPQNW